MIRKIISIKNVGRFLNCSASGDVEFRRYNLIFAENGRGKTTLCAVLRSLQSDEPAHVVGRTTLGTVDRPTISVLLDRGIATFDDGGWTTAVPEIAIFDSTFISHNVYSGDTVNLDQKRSLYRVLIGEPGVVLARRIETLDAANRAKSTEIREKLAVVQAVVPQGVAVEDFLGLESDPAIEARIAEKEKELEAVKEVEQIKSRSALSELFLLEFPGGLETLLSKTIEGIAADVELRVAGQINVHAMHERGEAWLSEGLGYVRDDACPFCGQVLEGTRVASLMGAYKVYFGDAYKSLQAEIATLRQAIEGVFGERKIAGVESLLEKNATSIDFWSRFSEIVPPILGLEDAGVGEAFRNLRRAALALLDRKVATPLERVAPHSAFTAAKAEHTRLQTMAATYNQAVQTANATIAAKKAATSSADISDVEVALRRLRATKKRHEIDGRTVCHAYVSAQAEKEALEAEKEGVKRELDDYSNHLIGRYEQSINRLLDDFNAGFRITGTTHGYPGGVASSSYQILINDTAVDLGDENTPLDRPSFRNTLSSGDKSTLALAFFLAQLDHDPDKAAKIVVFDDPFNSQDSFRKQCTVQKIKKCGEACSQVVVLSHDRSFLRRIWEGLAAQGSERRCLHLPRVGVRDTRIANWDIEDATQAQFLVDRKALAEYHNAVRGVPEDIVKKIRPVLETYCRNLYPEEFATDTLGTIIDKIRSAGACHQLFPQLDDLEALNEYTRRHHHGVNPKAPPEQIEDTELQGFVKKTLEVIGTC